MDIYVAFLLLCVKVSTIFLLLRFKIVIDYALKCMQIAWVFFIAVSISITFMLTYTFFFVISIEIFVVTRNLLKSNGIFHFASHAEPLLCTDADEYWTSNRLLECIYNCAYVYILYIYMYIYIYTHIYVCISMYV